MGRRIWLVIAVAAAVLAVVAANAPGASQEKRSSSVTKGLDYFHARQGANAGFGDPSTTGWVIMAAAANKEPIDGTAWRKGGEKSGVVSADRRPCRGGLGQLPALLLTDDNGLRRRAP